MAPACMGREGRPPVAPYQARRHGSLTGEGFQHTDERESAPCSFLLRDVLRPSARKFSDGDVRLGIAKSFCAIIFALFIWQTGPYWLHARRPAC